MDHMFDEFKAEPKTQNPHTGPRTAILLYHTCIGPHLPWDPAEHPLCLSWQLVVGDVSVIYPSIGMHAAGVTLHPGFAAAAGDSALLLLKYGYHIRKTGRIHKEYWTCRLQG
jgi:hypothetical protein